MIYRINFKKDYEKRKRALFVSLFIPGGGQIINERYSGLFFIIVNTILISFLIFIRKTSLWHHWLIISGFIIFYIINILDAFLGPTKRKSPCQKACPAEVNVPDYISLIADRRFEEAKALIKRRIPFASVCGTICPAFCEVKCIRKGYDEEVMIMKLKKSVCDYEESVENVKCSDKKTKIAIVGSGAAGLSLAYFLSKRGFKSIIYEKENEAGGLLRYGIPRFRMDMLDVLKDIESILNDENIKIIFNKHIGRDYPIDELLRNYDYVFLAIGNSKPVFPDIDIPQHKNIQSGIDFLKKASINENFDLIDKNTAIVGGGNVAVDSARTVIRLGGNAEIIYRKDSSKMPAHDYHIDDALEEGVCIIDKANIVSVNIIDERVSLVLTDNETHEKFTKIYNFVIFATGQKMDLTQFDVNIALKNMIKTNFKNLYVVQDAGTVIETIKNAEKLAVMINYKVSKQACLFFEIYNKIEYHPKIRKINDAAWNYQIPKKEPKENLYCIDIEKRKNSFFKVERDLNLFEAVKQAKRCFRCYTKKGIPWVK